MFRNKSIYNLLRKKEKNKDEDEIMQHLKGFKKKPENPRTDFIKEEEAQSDMELKQDENDSSDDENNKKNKKKHTNIIPDARYSEYQHNRNRLKKFITKFDKRGYSYET